MFSQFRSLALSFLVLLVALFTLGNARTDSNVDVLVQASSQLAGFTLSSRMMSMSTGKPQCVRAVGPFSLISYKPQSRYLENIRPKMPKGVEIDFPLGVSMLDTDWSVCFGTDDEQSEALKVRLSGPEDNVIEVEVGVDGSILLNAAALSS